MSALLKYVLIRPAHMSIGFQESKSIEDFHEGAGDLIPFLPPSDKYIEKK